MIENDERTSVDRILGLASKWQLADATTLVNDLSSSSQSEALIACRALLHGVSEIREGRYEAGIQESLPVLTYLEQHGFTALLNWAYSSIGFAFGMLGSPEIGLEWVNKAIVGAERRSDESQLRRSFSDEGQLWAMLDEIEKSIASFENALAVQDSVPAPLEKVELFNTIAHTYLHFARRMEADASQRMDLARKTVELTQAALSILETESNERFQAASLENLGSALSILGNFTEAEVTFLKALPLSESYAHICVELLTSYAWLLYVMKRYQECDSLLTRAYALAQEKEQTSSIDRIFETRVRLAILAGGPEEVLTWSNQHFRFMEGQYRQRLTMIARNAGIFMELERTQKDKRETREQMDDLAVINKTRETQSRIPNEQALRDTLTGCLNRRGLILAAESVFVPDRHLGLVIADIDHFKSINDRHGPQAGDKILQAIAHIFNKSLRDSDRVARVDGEEFLLIINGVETDAAWGTCERIRLAVERYGWGTIAAGLRVTISIGMAVRMNDEAMDSLNLKAENALQQAKAAGRNRVISG
jgi:diguanylate cyclase (GGDEF)-like protein